MVRRRKLIDNFVLIALHYNQQIYTEAKLLSLLSEGSEYAFQVIYDLHRPRIFQVSMYYLKSPILAQEVVQDVFLKLWVEKTRLKAEMPVEAWLHTVAKNNIFNRLKRIAYDWKTISNLKLIVPQAVNNADDKLRNAQYSELLEKAIESMSEQQRRVFQLARREQLTYLQIGERFGISPLTVKTHMSRALEHIRNYFLSQGEELSLLVLLSLSFLF